MIFGYFTLLVALIISAVAEFYSIVGLIAIFAAAPIPVAVMGAALGVGKITAAVWLKINWVRAKWTYKVYLIPAVALLMFLTSMGIFGFLSKAHSDQTLISGDVQSKVAIYDEKIKTAKENIEADRKQLKQMDEAVDQVMARSTSEEGASKANAIRKSQQRDRAALAKSIETNQKLIAALNNEAAPIRAEIRKVEAEVGPIKYIAALIYGDNPDTNLLERAVRWVIILIVAVLDPLALVLILAAQQTIRWAKEEKEKAAESVAETITDSSLGAEVKSEPAAEVPQTITDTAPSEPVIDQHQYLKAPFAHFKNLKPMVAVPSEQPAPVIDETVASIEPNQDDSVFERPGDYLSPAEQSKFPKVPETAQRVKVEAPRVPETLDVRRITADNVAGYTPKSRFGLTFPATGEKGDMFLRVDQIPNRLYKYNGVKWIEVNKDRTDSYTYDEQYIDYLIERLKTGEYEIDQLSPVEQELVAQRLQSKNDNT